MNAHVGARLGTGRIIGYQRVSGADQNTERQLDGVELSEVFTDHAGVKDADRPQLRAMIEHVRAGDEVVVQSMDRLARSLDDLRRTVNQLTAKGVQVRFVTEALTFGDTSAQVMLSAMGAVADFERSLLLEQQREDIAKALQKVRKPALTRDQCVMVERRLDEGESAEALAREYGVSRVTIYDMRWRTDDVIAVDDLYRQHGYPLDASHRLVDLLARRIKRTPTAIAERMINLHGAHTEPGYPGTHWHFTKLDRTVADRTRADR